MQGCKQSMFSCTRRCQQGIIIALLPVAILSFAQDPSVLAAELRGFYTSSYSGEGYSHDDSSGPVTDGEFADWMKFLDDNATISSLSIPGTHDSLSRCNSLSECNSIALLKDVTKTQSMTLYDQLVSGIRYLDVRIKYCKDCDEYDCFEIVHGIISQGLTLKHDVLSVVRMFLSEYRSEMIIMRLKNEKDDFNLDQNAMKVLSATLETYSDIMLPKDCGVSGKGLHGFILGDGYDKCHFRGKFIIQQDGYQLPLVSFFYDEHPTGDTIQDDFHASTNWDLANIKWPKVKEFMMKAHEGDASSLYLNYLTMSGGGFPYFFASGQLNPANGDPKMSTGWVTKKIGANDPCWFDVPKKECQGKWPDFPRTDRVCIPFAGCYATISFEGVPQLVINYLSETRPDYGPLRLGVMAADFPGSGFITSIVNNNYNKHGNPMNIGPVVRNHGPLAKLEMKEFINAESQKVIILNASESIDPNNDRLWFEWNMLEMNSCVVDHGEPEVYLKKYYENLHQMLSPDFTKEEEQLVLEYFLAIDKNVKLLTQIKREKKESNITWFVCKNDAKSSGVVELTVRNSFGSVHLTVDINTHNITMLQ